MKKVFKTVMGSLAVALGLTSMATRAAEKEVRNGETAKSEKADKEKSEKDVAKRKEPICGA